MCGSVRVRVTVYVSVVCLSVMRMCAPGLLAFGSFSKMRLARLLLLAWRGKACAHSGRRGRVATPALLSPPHPQVPSLVPTHPLSWGLCIQTGALHPHSLASARAPCWLPQAPCPDFLEFPPIFLNHL